MKESIYGIRGFLSGDKMPQQKMDVIVAGTSADDAVSYYFKPGEVARMQRKAIVESVLASAEIEGEGLPPEIADRIRDQL